MGPPSLQTENILYVCGEIACGCAWGNRSQTGASLLKVEDIAASVFFVSKLNSKFHLLWISTIPSLVLLD